MLASFFVLIHNWQHQKQLTKGAEGEKYLFPPDWI